MENSAVIYNLTGYKYVIFVANANGNLMIQMIKCAQSIFDFIEFQAILSMEYFIITPDFKYYAYGAYDETINYEHVFFIALNGKLLECNGTDISQIYTGQLPDIYTEISLIKSPDAIANAVNIVDGIISIEKNIYGKFQNVKGNITISNGEVTVNGETYELSDLPTYLENTYGESNSNKVLYFLIIVMLIAFIAIIVAVVYKSYKRKGM